MHGLLFTFTMMVVGGYGWGMYKSTLFSIFQEKEINEVRERFKMITTFHKSSGI